MQLRYTMAALTVVTALLVTPLLAQDGGGLRRLAPGVVTTIPATPEKDETFTGPRPMVEITVGREVNAWEPEFTATSDTLQEIASRTVYRRRIEQLEFSFKPLRMIEVDFPQPDGTVHRKLIWYFLYRLRNTGHHLQPVAGTFAADDELRLQLDRDDLALFELEGDDESTWVFPQTRLGTQEVNLSIACVPTFVLEVHDEGQTSMKGYLDRIIPNALEPIRQREDPNLELLNSVQISEQRIEVSTDQEDRSVWGVAMWEDVDPTSDFLSIYIQGLSNAYRWDDPEGGWQPGDEPGAGRELTYKTLQLNFWRPGDALFEHDEEIHYGLPLLADEKETNRLLGVYGIEEPLDYLWIYR